MLEIQPRARLAPARPLQAGGLQASTCTHLGLDQLVVPLYLQHVARLAADGALGAVVAVAAGAVERGVLHHQLRTISGLTREVHTAGGRKQAGKRELSCRTSALQLEEESQWPPSPKFQEAETEERKRRLREGRGAGLGEEDSGGSGCVTSASYGNRQTRVRILESFVSYYTSNVAEPQFFHL